MGYSGFTQYFCSNGHVNHRNCYDDDSDLTKNGCDRCGAPIVIYNGVDTTNGSWDENNKRIDGAIEPDVVRMDNFECKCCKGTGIQQVEVYDMKQVVLAINERRKKWDDEDDD